VTGPSLFGLPVEELLFFFCIPYCSVFTLYCFDKFIPRKKNDFRFARKLSLFFGAVLLIAALLFAGRKYTASTFSLLAIFIFLLGWKMPERLPRFFLVYLVILLPFFLSNGILTGSFIDEPVVRYNDAENIGIRLFTIPAEDVFYGLLLLLMNFAGYAFLRDRSAKNASA
jgi:lycopene cyclase domain-containing protein